MSEHVTCDGWCLTCGAEATHVRPLRMTDYPCECPECGTMAFVDNGPLVVNRYPPGPPDYSGTSWTYVA